MKIESLQNQTVKNLVRLKNKKDRDATQTFLVQSAHLIEEAEKAGVLKAVYQLEDLPVISKTEPVYCTQAVLNKISSQNSDASYIGLCVMPKPKIDEAKKILILDRIQDPGNAGTLIRSALAFGMDEVILSPGCADVFGPKAIQSSQGAIFHIPVIMADLTKEIGQLKDKGVQIYGTALHTKAIELHNLHPEGPFALIIGNEGQGISQEVLDLCDEKVFIEMQTFESLNAAVAGSIAMYWLQISSK